MTRFAILAVVTAGGLALVACGTDDQASGPLRVYTSVTQDTVDAVVAGFEEANPQARVEVFRAPTGELTARIAAEQREGGLQADILWLTDPLSIQQYDRAGLFRTWIPAEVEAVPVEFRTDNFFGTRVLNLVIVASPDLEFAPRDWDDLAETTATVAIPDPGFAGSAFGALGFFALNPDHGMDFYRRLRDNGAVEVRSPGDVVSGVAEGLYGAGITLDRSARAAVEDGSPLELIWPASGAISLYSPIAVVDSTEAVSFAESFVNHVLSEEGQTAIASTGWEPVRADVDWPDHGPQQTVDWAQAFDRQEELLDSYRDIFDR